jgi:4-amino-4-deoxy-L-arabinose transferase-like glycosyltransferase
MADVFGIVFSAAGILLFLVYANSKDVRALLLCGIAQGLALASKYSTVLGLVATAILLLILSKERFSVRELAVNEVVFVGSSISLGILANPFFYLNPIHGALTLAKYMSGGFDFASLNSIQSNPITALLGIVGSLLVPIPENYVGTYLGTYLGTYATVAVSGLFAIGFVKLVSEVGKGPNRNATGTVLLTWVGVYVVGLLLTDKATWIGRYYLPLIPLIALIAAYGFSILVRGMDQRLSALTVSLLTLSMVLNVLAFYPEFYQAAWGNAGDLPSQFGTFQVAILRPVGIMSVTIAALTVSTLIAVNLLFMNAGKANLTKIDTAYPAVYGIVIFFYALLVPPFVQGVHWLITLAAILFLAAIPTIYYSTRRAHEAAAKIVGGLFAFGMIAIIVADLLFALSFLMWLGSCLELYCTY